MVGPFSQLKTLFPNDTSLCQIDIKLVFKLYFLTVDMIEQLQQAPATQLPYHEDAPSNCEPNKTLLH